MCVLLRCRTLLTLSVDYRRLRRDCNEFRHPLAENPPRRSRFWWICCLLLLASAINYMDRQMLANAAVRISREFNMSRLQYGNLEAGFGWAFAIGSLLFGFLADKVPMRWLYATVLLLQPWGSRRALPRTTTNCSFATHYSTFSRPAIGRAESKWFGRLYRIATQAGNSGRRRRGLGIFSLAQQLFGRHVDETDSFDRGLAVAGCLQMIALAVGHCRAPN